MNNLSWFIYLTQVVDSVQSVAGVTFVLTLIFGTVAMGFATFYRYLEDAEDTTWFIPLFTKMVRIYLSVLIISGLLGIFVPERRTMLMIAASELGERLSKSDKVQSVVDPAMDLLKTWIQRETEKLKEKK